MDIEKKKPRPIVGIIPTDSVAPSFYTLGEEVS